MAGGAQGVGRLVSSTMKTTLGEKRGDAMLPDLSGLWAKLETRHQEMFDLIDGLTPDQLLLKPEKYLQHALLSL
jgi:hypothetical protein